MVNYWWTTPSSFHLFSSCESAHLSHSHSTWYCVNTFWAINHIWMQLIVFFATWKKSPGQVCFLPPLCLFWFRLLRAPSLHQLALFEMCTMKVGWFLLSVEVGIVAQFLWLRFPPWLMALASLDVPALSIADSQSKTGKRTGNNQEAACQVTDWIHCQASLIPIELLVDRIQSKSACF